MEDEIKLRTFISRMGNKTRHIKHFINYIPKDYNTFIEPFVGSGALLLHLKPNKWIINDINKEIIGLWLIVLNSLDYILKYLKNFGNKYTKIKTIEEKVIYMKKLTEKLNNLNECNEKYVLWMILNHTQYRGTLVIKNNKYIFNTINNASHNIPFLIKEKYFNLLKNINQYLNGTSGKVYNTDYKNILKKVKENDFVFLDPPYLELKIYDKHKYNFDTNLTIKFLKELYDEVKKLDKRNVKWMMTQENSKEVRDTFKEYKIRKYKVYRTFLKKYVYELFITNY
jgi:DNA adenine methylase